MKFKISSGGNLIRSLIITMIIVSLLFVPSLNTAAAEAPGTKDAASSNIYEQRLSLYQETGMYTHIPWYWLAAVDQYERTITPQKQLDANKNRLTGLRLKEAIWAGPFNPNPSDTIPVTIGLFGGFGKDATGDGAADRENDRDALFTLASYLRNVGYEEEDLRIALWRYYQNDSSVTRIRQFAKIYKKYGRVDLHASAFPVPIKSVYTYRDTWGDRRGWGGIRIHEGTDIFASYGVPVRSVCYGIVETKGWNPYGGWRIGIRDLNNRYHYYAHLQGYEKHINVGDIVEPGQTIGWVGSSGYGPPGTQGRFPPHLHYGIYRDTGTREWAFNPYPLLRQWEKGDRRKK